MILTNVGSALTDSKRPRGLSILNFTYDLDSYATERGFLYSLNDAIPNTPARTFAELLIRLDAALDRGQMDAVQYARVRSLFHTHTGSPSAVVARHIAELHETPLMHPLPDDT